MNAPAPLVGRTLDNRYEVQRLLGEGAMGAVYLGRQVAMDREVAIKVIHPAQLSQSRAVGRFMQEARAVSSLHHPNIVTVHDFGRTEDGILYLVMEFLHGVTLDSLLVHGALPADRVVPIGMQLCAGLEAAHARGVVHRDLKPVNVMLCQAEGFGPLVKILDFGIARVFDQGGPLTGDGIVVGTPAYMAPEQGQGLPAGPAADLYSLATVLYQMLSGTLPFDVASTSVMLAARRQMDAPPLSSRTRQPVAEAIERIIMMCLARRPEDRPASAAAVRAALAGQVDQTTRPGLAANAPPGEPAGTDPTPGTLATPPPPTWRRGHIVADRYRIEHVDRTAPCETARALDLRSPEGSEVVLRRVPLADEHQADLAEILVEDQLAVLARFRHPGMVALRDASLEGATLFLASDPPPQASLDHRLTRTGRLPWRAAVRIALDLLPTLEALHGLGIVHLDLRPGTVWLGRNDHPVLEGAGIWLLAEAGLPILPAEDVAQARLYKAPEQLGALNEPLGPETDIYALGAVLYQMVTDCLPFEARSELDVTSRKLTAAIPPPSMIVPEIPALLDEVVVRLLRARPIDRFRSVTAVREALERVLAGGTPSETRLEVFRRLGAEGQMHGRDPERRRLLAMVARLTESGTGGTALLRGQAGVGKTRLAEDLAFEVRRRGGLVVRAKARDGDAATPLSMLRNALGALGLAIERCDGDRREATRNRIRSGVGELGAIVRPFAPWLECLFAGAEPVPPLDVGSTRDRLLATLCQVTLAAASQETPICLLLDDIQWMDAATGQAIERLATQADRHALLLLCCTRDGEGGSQGVERLAAVGASVIDLGNLGAESVETFVTERLGPIPQVGAVAAEFRRLSDGNPAGLRELFQQAEQSGVIAWNGTAWSVNQDRLPGLPPAATVVDRMRSRLGMLAPGTGQVLDAAAVWGAPFDLALVAALLPDCARLTIVDGLIEAERADLLRAVPGVATGQRDFAHDALREAVLAGIPLAERRVLHRRAAELLARNTLSIEDREQRRADHLLRADRRASDAGALEEAARRALQGFGGEGAVRLAEAALACLEARPESDPDVTRVRLLLASTYLAARRPDDAARINEAVLASSPEPQLHARTLAELADALFTMGRLRDSIDAYGRAATLLGYRRNRSRTAGGIRIAWRLAREVWLETRKPRGYDAERVPEWRRSLLADVLNHQARARFFVDGAAAGGSLMDALHEARRSGDLPAYVRILSQVGGQLASGLGWVTLSRRVLDASVRAAEASRDPHSQALALGTRLMIFEAVGDFERFDAERPAAEALVARVGEPWAHALFLAYVFDAAQERGRPSEGLPVVTALTDLLVTGRHRDFAWGWALNRGAWVALAIGRPDLGRMLVDRGLEHPYCRDDRVLLGYLRGLDVQASADAGDPDRAVQAAEAFEDFLRAGTRARRHFAIAASIATKAASAATLEAGGGPAAVAVLTRMLARTAPLVRPFPVYRLHHDLCEVRLDLIRGRHPSARRRVESLLPAARALTRGTVISAEVLHLASELTGGLSSPAGRALLREAWDRLQGCDGCLPFKGKVARELGEAVAGATESRNIASALASALRLPPGSGPESRAPFRSATSTLLPHGTLELFETTHAAVGAIARGEAGLVAMLGPVARFAGADLGLIVRCAWATRQFVPIAAFPEGAGNSPELLDRVTMQCLAVAERGGPVVDDVRDTNDGFLRGCSATFPVAGGALPELVVYLANRSTPGVFDVGKMRNVEAVLPAIEAAVLLSGRVTTGADDAAPSRAPTKVPPS